MNHQALVRESVSLPHAWSEKLLVAEKPVDEARHGQLEVSVASFFRRDIAPEVESETHEKHTHTHTQRYEDNTYAMIMELMRETQAS